MNMERFDGADFWSKLTPDRQAGIGRIAVELAVSGLTLERVLLAAPGDLGNADVLERASSAARAMLLSALETAVAIESGSAILDNLPIPSSLGPVCMRCGCSEEDACEGGCSWSDNSKTVCTECTAAEVVS